VLSRRSGFCSRRRVVEWPARVVPEPEKVQDLNQDDVLATERAVVATR
jgi:hypothetical protein